MVSAIGIVIGKLLLLPIHVPSHDTRHKPAPEVRSQLGFIALMDIVFAFGARSATGFDQAHMAGFAVLVLTLFCACSKTS